MLCIYQYIANIYYITICILILISFLINDVVFSKTRQIQYHPFIYSEYANEYRENIYFFQKNFNTYYKSMLICEGILSLLRKKCPFKVFEKVNENAYHLYLPGEFNISHRINIADLSHLMQIHHFFRKKLSHECVRERKWC